MEMKLRTIFSVAVGGVLLALPSAHAATANSSANLPATNTNAGSNLNATMTQLFGDPVIAKGKGFEIKQSDLDQTMTSIKAAAAERNQTIAPAQLRLLQGVMLDRLIQVQLLLQTANDADKAEGKKTADQQMKTLLDKAGSQEALSRQFMVLGLSMADLQKRLDQENTAQVALVRALKITVSDAEARQFYDEHPGEFELPERVQIQQIFFSTRDPLTGAELPDTEKAAKKKEAEDVLKRVKAGADFKSLAVQYSEDPTVKKTGGEYTIARGQTLPEFEASAFSLATNQISDLVTTASGYHIIKLLARMPAKKLDFDSVLPNQTPPNALKVSDYIKNFLTNQKAQKLAPPYVATLEKKENVQILDPDLKAAVEQAQAQSTNAPAVAPEGGK